MEDLLQGPPPNKHQPQQHVPTQNRRLVSFVRGLCGDDGSQCPDDEFVVVGTGERMFGRDLSSSHLNSDTNDASNKTPSDKDAPTVSWFTLGGTVSLLGILVVVGFMFRSDKFRHWTPLRNKKSKQQTNTQNVRRNNATKRKAKNDTTTTINKIVSSTGKEQTNADADAPAEGELETAVQSATQSVPREESIILNGEDECNNRAVSQSLSTFSDIQLKQSGQEVAHNLSVIMSEFESTMKQRGYNAICQSDCMAVASQRLALLEARQANNAAEARHYLYDSQQRNLDRSLAEQRHSSSMLAHEQDKDWFPKLQSARDTCTQAILPSIQKNCMASALCVVAYHVWLHYGSGSGTHSTYSSIAQVATDMLFQNTENRKNDVFSDEEATRKAATTFPTTGWFVFPYLILVLSRVWMLAVLPLAVLVLLFVASVCLPMGTVLQLARSLLVVAFLGWTVSFADEIPWKALVVGQVVFAVLAYVWCQIRFDRSVRQLGRSSLSSSMSPTSGCPSSHDVFLHLSTFDQMTQSMVGCSCCVNLVILSWSFAAAN